MLKREFCSPRNKKEWRREAETGEKQKVRTSHFMLHSRTWVQVFHTELISFHITGHHAPSKTYFHPKTRQEDFLYVTRSSWVLKSRLVKVIFPPFWHPFCFIFSKGNGPKWSIWPTTGSFHSIFVAMIFVYKKNALIQIGAVGGEIWRIGSEM